MLPPSPAVDHEWLQSGLADAVDRYVGLSRSYAARGEGRLAQLAVWAADVHVLQILLWESGLGSSPDPDAQLAAVGEAVTESVTEFARTVHAPLTAREAVEHAREAMVATFDESVHALLADRFLPLEHLDELERPVGESADGAVARRLEGRSPQALVADLQATAADCMGVAAVMLRGGDTGGALRQARQADIATFEEYLVAVAVGLGDSTLATVDLRWDLAAAADREAAAVGDVSTDDFETAVAGFRERLVGLVGPAEEVALRDCFEPVPVVGH
jgi:hypothetical protein